MIGLETIYRDAPANPGAHNKGPTGAQRPRIVAGIISAYAQTKSLDLPTGSSDVCPGADDPDGLLLVSARNPYGRDTFNSVIRASDSAEILVVEGLVSVVMGDVRSWQFLSSEDGGETAHEFFPSKRTWANLLDMLTERKFEVQKRRIPLPVPPPQDARNAAARRAAIQNRMW